MNFRSASSFPALLVGILSLSFPAIGQVKITSVAPATVHQACHAAVASTPKTSMGYERIKMSEGTICTIEVNTRLQLATRNRSAGPQKLPISREFAVLPQWHEQCSSAAAPYEGRFS